MEKKTLLCGKQTYCWKYKVSISCKKQMHPPVLEQQRSIHSFLKECFCFLLFGFLPSFGSLICHASLGTFSDGGGSLGRHPPVRQKGSSPVDEHLLHLDHSEESIIVKHLYTFYEKWQYSNYTLLYLLIVARCLSMLIFIWFASLWEEMARYISLFIKLRTSCVKVCNPAPFFLNLLSFFILNHHSRYNVQGKIIFQLYLHFWVLLRSK